MDTVLKYLLPSYFVFYLLIAFFLPSYRTWKQTGVNPYKFGQTAGVHDFVGLLFRLTLIACLGVIACYSFLPTAYQYLTPIAWLQHSTFVTLGLGLLVFSLLWTLVAQAQMGRSWRIGIDTSHKTELVQTGIFHLSRNPVFLGMRLTLLGVFFLLPNAVSFAIVVVGDLLIQIQVRLEEEFLAKTHGELYRKYCEKTRRWI